VPAVLQRPPRLAADYSEAQRRRFDEGVAAAVARWRSIGTRFDAGWAIVGGAIVSDVVTAQRNVITAAGSYVPQVLRDTGQGAAAATFATPAVAQLAGLNGGGFDLRDSLSAVTIRAKQAVAAGQSLRQAMTSSELWLAMQVDTALADTARSAEALESYVRPTSGFVRMVNGGACGRCVILAGRWYRKSEGFERHPRCRCVHIPSVEDTAGDWQTDPRAYFDSLTDEQQIKLMGSKANAQAVRDSADMGQIINAYRQTDALSVAQPIRTVSYGSGRTAKYTLEGTTRRGHAYRSMSAHGASRSADDVRSGRVSRARPARIMPESIYKYADDQEHALRLLRTYGWVL
jgi:hypothetical protein